MKKTILTILLLAFCVSISGAGIVDSLKSVIARKNAGNNCPPGTYILHWNGEQTDASYICQDSGATTADAISESAGVIVAGGAIGGMVGALLDADAEHVTWTIPAASKAAFAADGTIEMSVTIPAATGADFQFGIACGDANDYTYSIRNWTNQRFEMERIGGGVGDWTNETGDLLTHGNTFTICQSWQLTGTDIHCVLVDTGANSGCVGDGEWECDTEELSAYGTDPTTFSIGEEATCRATNQDPQAYKIDNVELRLGYEGTAP